MFKEEKCKERLFVRHSAAVIILLLFRVKNSNNTEHVNELRRHLFKNIVPHSTKALNLTKEPQESEPIFQQPQPVSTPRSPVLCTPNRSSNLEKTPLSSRVGRSPLSTLKLVEARDLRKNINKGGQHFRQRTLDARIKQHESSFVKIAETVHHGLKDDFLAAIAESVNRNKTNTCDTSTGNWDGSLTANDLIYMSKRAYDCKKKKSVYEILTTECAAKNNHISAMEIIKMQDNCSMTEIFRALRRKLPGYFVSERQTEKLKSQFNEEFRVIFEPVQTKTGYRINPEKLVECLRFVYPWLAEIPELWWRLYGDARTYGGKKSVLLCLSNVNNETLLNDVNFQSPQDCWPIHIFYGGDSRLNLELNISKGGKPGYLNDFVETVHDNGDTVFVASDSMFADAVLGGKLDPKSDTEFNLYNYETVFTKSEVGKVTGLRSELERKIEREHPESLLPAIPTEHFVPCANHMFARITEHLLKRRVISCMELEALNNSKVSGAYEKDAALKHLVANINARGVRNGNFSLSFEQHKLQPITLNVKCSELISAPPSAFSTKYNHLLDNVASHKEFLTPLPPALQKLLNWPTTKITEYELEKEIWRVHWELHLLCRKTLILVRSHPVVQSSNLGFVMRKFRSTLRLQTCSMGFYCTGMAQQDSILM